VDARVRVVLRIVEEKKGDRDCLSQATIIFGLSEAYLLRLFKREVGKTFSQYLLDVGMRAAANLLTVQSRSVKEVSLACGYSDVSNFHRDFKIVYGTTPRHWRHEQLMLHDANRLLKGISPQQSNIKSNSTFMSDSQQA